MTDTLRLFAVVGLLGVATEWAAANPQVEISGIERIQPGWIRVYLTTAQEPAGVRYRVATKCKPPTDQASVVTSTYRGKNLAIDFKVDLVWLARNSLPQPCYITEISVDMLQATNRVAGTLVKLEAPLDLPLSHITPSNTQLTFSETSIPLQRSAIHTAYPPMVVGIQSVTGAIGFAEIEELPHRGTVGLRALSAFRGGNLFFELGGGGEIPSGWGLDVNGLGIWRSPELPEEISNPGRDAFPYTGTTQPAILTNDPSLKIYPAPPLFTEADYREHVLDNRGILRCLHTTGCMDIVYDEAEHRIRAVNGAKLALVTAASLSGLIAGYPGAVIISAELSPPTPSPLGPHLSRPNLGKVSEISNAVNGSNRGGTAIEKMGSALIVSATSASGDRSPRDSAKVVIDPSPQENTLVPPSGTKNTKVYSGVGASCVINAARNGVISAPTQCSGMSRPGFNCPTASDPIDIDAITTNTTRAAIVNGVLPPYYAGRTNIFGTCGTHAMTQYIEALLAKYSDDLAIRRVIYVNGDPIVVPQPRVALSVSASLVQLYTWGGTRNDPSPWPASSGAYPNYPEAYWTAREGNYGDWTAAVAQHETCGDFWKTGFCIGQGRPGPGVYRSHSLQVQNFSGNPLADGVWSLANSYFNFVQTTISLNDRDQAIQDVMQKVREGLPVNMAFNSRPEKIIQDQNGDTVSYRSDPTWYLPPQLAGCDTLTLERMFVPVVGHFVNIIGYWLSGSPTKPDLINSYFIIQNNWGKDGGYRSFYFMNFAAFKFLAYSLHVYQLDRECNSVACAYLPPRPARIPRQLLKPLLYPPDPSGPIQQRYQQLLTELLPQLGGIRRQPGHRSHPALGPKQRVQDR